MTHTYETSISSSDNSTMQFIERCHTAPFPDLMWNCVSFVIYSLLWLYVGFQLSRSGYHGSRGVSAAVKFPENLIHMLYVWLLHSLFGVLSAFMAYAWMGGWASATVIPLSLYLITEPLHCCWMVALFRYAMYSSALCIHISLLAVQSYIVVLLHVIHPLLSIVYFPCLIIGCYEILVGGILLFGSCGSLKLLTSRVNRYRHVSVSAEEQGSEEAV